jgi:hypothetical protein
VQYKKDDPLHAVRHLSLLPFQAFSFPPAACAVDGLRSSHRSVFRRFRPPQAPRSRRFVSEVFRRERQALVRSFGGRKAKLRPRLPPIRAFCRPFQARPSARPGRLPCPRAQPDEPHSSPAETARCRPGPPSRLMTAQERYGAPAGEARRSGGPAPQGRNAAARACPGPHIKPPSVATAYPEPRKWSRGLLRPLSDRRNRGSSRSWLHNGLRQGSRVRECVSPQFW